MNKRERKKLTSMTQLSENGIYRESDFDKKKFQEFLKDGFIYEFKKGYFKRI